MPRLYRPSIPDSVKVAVALRQLEAFNASQMLTSRSTSEALKQFLKRLLRGLALYLGCKPEELRLDHNPALGTRMKRTKTVHTRGKVRQITIYSPDANNPAHLIYRTAHDHHIKTNVRGDGAQYSDTVLMKRERRRKKVKKQQPTRSKAIAKQKPKQKIPARKIQSRPFPKGRKFNG